MSVEPSDVVWPIQQPRETGLQRQRRRYKEAGLVQINIWVPEGRRDTILTAARLVRNGHLKIVGYKEDGDGKWGR